MPSSVLGEGAMQHLTKLGVGWVRVDVEEGINIKGRNGGLA